jgi:NAD(P)H-flavin reductase
MQAPTASGNGLMATDDRQCLVSELLINTALNREIFRLDFAWVGPAPRAGQFFMIKPQRSAVFLARPISVALYQYGAKPEDIDPRKHRRRSYEEKKWFTSNTIRFLIARRGKGTEEIINMRVGDTAELTGPLGNCWAKFLPLPEKGGAVRPIALIGGGIGVAPLEAFAAELAEGQDLSKQDLSELVPFDFYAGFRTRFKTKEEQWGIMGSTGLNARKVIIAAEDGSDLRSVDLRSVDGRAGGGGKGLIPDYLDPGQYAGVYACGPEPMLRAVAAKCKQIGTPCYISMERRMACGVGACLGCTIKTTTGNGQQVNRRCCADGPIFNAEELVFDE